MRGNKIVVGVFTFVDDAIKSIKAAQDGGHEIDVYAPTYVPELEHAYDHHRSPIARFTAVGALFGCSAGFALACWTALDWPLRVSAKDIVAPPSVIVVGYEWTILFGALFTLLGVMVLCRLPRIFRKPGYDVRFSEDKFGVVVNCHPNEVERIESKMKEFGADDVEVRDAL